MKNNDKTTKTKNAASERIASYIVLCFFASFNVCFFVPMDIFLANAEEIAFPIKPLLLFMGLVTLAVFAALFLACVLTRGKANQIVHAIVFGVSAGLYIQGNFLAVNMGLLNGSRYELSLWKAALSTVIWLVILTAPFFIMIKFPDVFESAMSYIPAAIILIQAIALTVSSYSSLTDISESSMWEVFGGDTRWINTTDNLDLYSENKNLIIILADEYDSSVFDSVTENEPDTLSEFDSFTYYTNTVGKYGFTGETLAYIMSADKDDRFADLTFLKTVSKNYRANFYLDTALIPAPMLSDYSDNIILKKITLNDTRGYAGSIYKIAFFRCAPELFKPLFKNSAGFEQELVSNTAKNLDIISEIPKYSYDNLIFYNTMPRELRTTDEDVFKFIYIFGLHDPRSVTRDLERAPGYSGVEIEDEAVAVNKIVNEYFRILKEHGMYDNSEIIFMADHGHYEGKKYPLLMYKPAHQTETGIKISNAPISYDDMFPTLVKLAGGEPNARTIFDIGEDEERVRYFGIDNEEITGNIKQDPQ